MAMGLLDAVSVPVSRSWKPAGSGQDFGSINSHYRALAESKQTFDRTSFGTPRTGSAGVYHWRVGPSPLSTRLEGKQDPIHARHQFRQARRQGLGRGWMTARRGSGSPMCAR